MRNPLIVDKATLFERLGYEPHSDSQRQYHDSTARFRIPICGRRWGKSKATGTTTCKITGRSTLTNDVIAGSGANPASYLLATRLL